MPWICMFGQERQVGHLLKLSQEFLCEQGGQTMQCSGWFPGVHHTAARCSSLNHCPELPPKTQAACCGTKAKELQVTG